MRQVLWGRSPELLIECGTDASRTPEDTELQTLVLKINLKKLWIDTYGKHSCFHFKSCLWILYILPLHFLSCLFAAKHGGIPITSRICCLDFQKCTCYDFGIVSPVCPDWTPVCIQRVDSCSPTLSVISMFTQPLWNYQSQKVQFGICHGSNTCMIWNHTDYKASVEAHTLLG